MITARQYEEKMIELSEEYKDKPETMKELAQKLNIDVLECFGYTSGAMIYKERIKKARGVLMTEKELEKIREFIIDNVMTNEDIMFSDDRVDGVDLPEIIASLYELLHQQVTGKPYQYFHHFANKIGSDVENNLFS